MSINPPSVDIKDMLEAVDIGLTFTENLFVGKEPDKPVDCVTIFDTPGGPPDVYYDKQHQCYNPSVQIRVRNVSYLLGWNLVNAIKEVLHNKVGETWGEMLYLAVRCVQEPSLLDWDKKNWCRFVATFDIVRGTL